MLSHLKGVYHIVVVTLGYETVPPLAKRGGPLEHGVALEARHTTILL